MAGDLAHFAINADDVAASRRFYEAVLGWRFTAAEWPDFYRITKEDGDRPGPIGVLQARRDLLPDGVPTNGLECTIAVDDVDVVAAAVVANGGRILMEKATIPGVGDLVFFADPSGTVLGAMRFSTRPPAPDDAHGAAASGTQHVVVRYSQFYLSGADGHDVEHADWRGNDGLLVTYPGGVLVCTGSSGSPVPVTVEVHDGEPALDLEGWEAAAETSFDAPLGEAFVVDWDGMRPDLPALLVPAGQRARARVHAHGRMDKFHSRGQDSYLVQLWVADGPRVVHRMDDMGTIHRGGGH